MAVELEWTQARRSNLQVMVLIAALTGAAMKILGVSTVTVLVSAVGALSPIYAQSPALHTNNQSLPAEVRVLEFKADLKRLVVPKSGKLSIDLPIESPLTGRIEISIPEPGSKTATPAKTLSGASMWHGIVRKMTISGAINATFENSTFYVGYDKIGVLHHSYSQSTLMCTGPNNPCKSAGTIITLREGEATERGLRPTGYRLINELKGGSFGDLGKSIQFGIDTLVATASEDQTYLIVYLSERDDNARDGVKTLWRINTVRIAD